MAKEVINVGTAVNDGTGDTLRAAMVKVNNNFTELYGSYTSTQINEAIRRTLTPYKLVTYLPISTPFTTASITANTPTKILLSTTQKSVNGFAIVDLGGGNNAYQFQGSTTSTFSVNICTGVTASTNNAVLTLEVYKNGVNETGISAIRKISSADTGNISLTGEFTLSPLDYVEFYVTTDLTSTFTFSRASINICERN